MGIKYKKRVKPKTQPRYDNVFYEGLVWLDGLSHSDYWGMDEMGNKKKKIICAKCGSEMLPCYTVKDTEPQIVVYDCIQCDHCLSLFKDPH